jgi:hypothetical protein
MCFKLRLRINLAKYWSPVGTLVSTADSESYGKSIRESLANCVPGMALERHEILKLRDMVKDTFMYLLSKNSEINHSNFRKTLETKFIGETPRILKNKQPKVIAKLIEYWRRLNNLGANK